MQVEATAPQQKEIKKRAPRPYKKVIVIPYSEENMELLEEAEVEQEGGEFSSLAARIPYEVREALLKLQSSEIKQNQKRYRREYSTRPIVKAKAQAKAQDPKTKEAQRAYARLESTRERKRLVNKRNRAIRKTLKEEKPELYESLMEKVISQYSQMSPEEFHAHAKGYEKGYEASTHVKVEDGPK